MARITWIAVYTMYIIMNIQIGKWGNSLGLRIPGPLAKELGLHDGSEIDLQHVDGALVLRPVAPEQEYIFKLEELLACISPETIHPETSWGEPEGNEAW